MKVDHRSSQECLARVSTTLCWTVLFYSTPQPPGEIMNRSQDAVKPSVWHVPGWWVCILSDLTMRSWSSWYSIYNDICIYICNDNIVDESSWLISMIVYIYIYIHVTWLCNHVNIVINFAPQKRTSQHKSNINRCTSDWQNTTVATATATTKAYCLTKSFIDDIDVIPSGKLT